MLCNGNKIHLKKRGRYIELDQAEFTIGVMRVRMMHCGDFISHHDESLCQSDSQAI